jgi:putative redox protein
MGPVVVKSQRSFRTEIMAGKHTFIADEPPEAGGSDQGPTPYDLLSAALGTCTSMTLHYYSQREKIPLEAVEVSIVNDRMHAKDCADCMSSSGFIHRFDVKLHLIGESLTEEQRLHLLEIARRCPVYKTLSSEIRIEEHLV